MFCEGDMRALVPGRSCPGVAAKVSTRGHGPLQKDRGEGSGPSANGKAGKAGTKNEEMCVFGFHIFVMLGSPQFGSTVDVSIHEPQGIHGSGCNAD